MFMPLSVYASLIIVHGFHVQSSKVHCFWGFQLVFVQCSYSLMSFLEHDIKLWALLSYNITVILSLNKMLTSSQSNVSWCSFTALLSAYFDRRSAFYGYKKRLFCFSCSRSQHKAFYLSKNSKANRSRVWVDLLD